MLSRYENRGAFVADRIGRRGGIIAAATVFMIGAIIQTAVHEVAGLTVGRVYVASFHIGTQIKFGPVQRLTVLLC